MENKPSESAISPGLLTGIITIVRNAAGLAFNRIELAALEISEVRANVLKLCLIFAFFVVAAWFAIAYWSVLIVVLAWDSMGWKIVLVMAAGFTAIGVALFMYARAMIDQGKLSMPTTMEELRKDRDALL
jgi:uncharacterized membrane protein YqjE